jgi:hypothetical protein
VLVVIPIHIIIGALDRWKKKAEKKVWTGWKSSEMLAREVSILQLQTQSQWCGLRKRLKLFFERAPSLVFIERLIAPTHLTLKSFV